MTARRAQDGLIQKPVINTRLVELMVTHVEFSDQFTLTHMILADRAIILCILFECDLRRRSLDDFP